MIDLSRCTRPSESAEAKIQAHPPYTSDYFIEMATKTFKNDIHLHLLREAAAAVS